MIRGTLCRERVRAWSHRRLTPVDARESLTPREPTYPRIRGVPPPHPHHGSAATRRADRFRRAGRGAQPVHPRMSVRRCAPDRLLPDTRSGQRGVGRSPFIPGWLSRRCAPDRLLPDGVPASGAWGGARSSPDVVASVRAEGSFRRPFREAECGAEPHTPKGGRVGLRIPLLRDARRGLRERLADVLAMPLQPIANVLE